MALPWPTTSSLEARRSCPHSAWAPLRAPRAGRRGYIAPPVGVGSPLLGDFIALPHEAFGWELPLWAKLGGLLVANILGVQVRGDDAVRVMVASGLVPR